MFLLKEFTTFDYDRDEVSATEAQNGGKFILHGILQRADTLNQNGRVYPAEILFREVENYKKLIREDRAFGTLDHQDSAVVSLQSVSHLVREIIVEGTTIKGAIEVMDTPCGNIVKAIIKAGGKPGISSRALGSVRKVGEVNVVQDDLQLICFDIVSEPSVCGAFMALSEGKEINFSELKKIFNKSDRIDRIVNELINLNKKV
jgi:hypothetical protein